MNNSSKIKKITAAAVIILAGLAAFMFLSPVEEEKQKPAKKEKPAAGGGSKKARPLVPDDPGDYGIVVFEGLDKPRTQQEWDNFLGGEISRLKSDFSRRKWKEIQEKISEDRKKTQEKIEKINKKMAECREILRADPANEKIKKKLQRLMILKSLATQFPHTKEQMP